MKYCLDTNACIKILNGSNENILQKIKTINNDNVFVPSIVRYELYYGAYKSNKSTKTLQILSEFLFLFETIIFNDTIAELAGKIRSDLDQKGTPIGPYDLMIAASALSRNAILITHNTREFSRDSNLKIED